MVIIKIQQEVETKTLSPKEFSTTPAIPSEYTPLCIRCVGSRYLINQKEETKAREIGEENEKRCDTEKFEKAGGNKVCNAVVFIVGAVTEVLMCLIVF